MVNRPSKRNDLIKTIFLKNEKSFIKKETISLIRIPQKHSITVNNRSTCIHTNGEETSLISSRKNLKKAKHHIHVEYFIIKDDDIGGGKSKIIFR